MKKIFYTLTIAVLFFAVSCETYEPEQYRPLYLLEGYLIAGKPLPEVYLSTTASLNEAYRFEDFAVSGATAQLILLADDGSGQPELAFSYEQKSPGVYGPVANVTQNVLPKRQYKLVFTGLTHPEISTNRIEAISTVPDEINIQRLGFYSQSNRPVFEPDSVYDVVYQQSDQLVVDLTLGEFTDGRDQHFYIFTMIAEDTAKSNLTPFYADVLDEDDFNDVLENESGIINQENYERNADNTISVRFPWIALAFYGRNSIVISSIDKNYYDFRRSQQVQLGGGTISPGEIHNPLYRIDGAIGVFGSLARAKFEIDVAPPVFPFSPD